MTPTTMAVWVALLVLADSDGVARTTERAVAAAADVTPAQAILCLGWLRLNDRIESVAGGWRIRRFANYRARA